MIYHPIEGDVYTHRIKVKPKTCFLMTKIGNHLPPRIKTIKSNLKRCLYDADIKIIDSSTEITGGDFLVKIWKIIKAVPLGIAIITNELNDKTIGNIFFELGILVTLGKSILIIKDKGCEIPSDFVRTEYIKYPKYFKKNLKSFLNLFYQQTEYYKLFASELDEEDPIAAIDYLVRAFIISGEEEIKVEISNRKKKIIDKYEYGNIQKKNFEKLILSNNLLI